MKNYILIAEKSVTFDVLKETFQKKFTCYEVLPNRLTIEKDDEHIFIDFDDEMKNNYEEQSIRNSDFHFYSVLYLSEGFTKEILSELKDENILVDDDNGNIVSIQDFLKYQR